MSQKPGSEVVPTSHSDAAKPPLDRTLSPAAKAALAAGVPEATAIAYAKDLQDFRDWCGDAGRVALPATAETLTEYATHLAYGPQPRSPATIERVRSSIKNAHRSLGLEPPDSLGLAKVVAGYREKLAEAKDPRAKKRRATAVTKDALNSVTAALDTSSPAGCRDLAIWLLGFAVAGRRSELAALNIEDVEETKDGLMVTVYRKKLKRFDDVAVIFAEDVALCPAVAVMRWKACLERHGRTCGPLFVRINRHGQLGPNMTRDGKPIGDPTGRMTGQAISQVIARTASAVALTGRWSGHSVRRGFATEARKAGHDQIRIARHGGWADHSTALAGYIEDADRWTDNALKGVL